MNNATKCSHGELYQNTVSKFNEIFDMGYKIKYMWETDWIDWSKKQFIGEGKIKTYENKNGRHNIEL